MIRLESANFPYHIELGSSPAKFDYAIVSASNIGSLGELNSKVLNECGYSIDDFPGNQLKELPFYMLRKDALIPILFVVTVGKHPTYIELEENLRSALIEYGEELKGNKVWLPLMGTGAGQLTLEESYNITVRTINSISPSLKNEVVFYLSIPSDLRGEVLFHNLILNTSQETDYSNPGRKYYLAGSIWNGEDQAHRFFSNNIWENGHEDKFVGIIRAVQPGDIIFLKSTFAQKVTSFLRIKGVGVVTFNPGDGINLEVSWKIKNVEIDIKDLGKYRSTFARVMPHDIEIILTAIGKEKINDADLSNLPIIATESFVDSCDQIYSNIDSFYRDLFNNRPASKALDFLLSFTAQLSDKVEKFKFIASDISNSDRLMLLNRLRVIERMYNDLLNLAPDEFDQRILTFEDAIKDQLIEINFLESQYSPFLRLKEESAKLKSEVDSYKKRLDEITEEISFQKSKSTKDAEDIVDLKKQVEKELNTFQERYAPLLSMAELLKSVEIFRKDAVKNLTQSKRWLLGTIFSILILIITLIWLVYCFCIDISCYNENVISLSSSCPDCVKNYFYFEIIGKSLLRFGLISVEIYIISFTAKSYFAAKHNNTVNDHKANSLAAAVNLIANAKSRTEKHEIMKHAAQAIFSHQKTGYLTKEEKIHQSTINSIIASLKN